MKKRKYTDEELVSAVKSARSIRQVLITIGLAPQGGNYRTIANYIKLLGIDTSHFTGVGWKKGDSTPVRPIEDYLSNNKTIQSFKLKNRLIREKILQPICSSCKRKSWLGKTIPLELDHIDGNHRNNSLVNLRLLCPNCHAMTPNYRGKNKRNV